MRLFGKKYKVDYCGQKFTYKNAKDEYCAGEKVTLYYYMIATDTDYSFSLEGAQLSRSYDQSKGFILSFTMPDHDVTLRCASKNTMLREVPPMAEKTDCNMEKHPAKLLYMGQASIRITTPEGRVIYIDPYAGNGYQPFADLILVTHDHFDHNRVGMVKNRRPDCQTVTWKEALEGGVHRTFDLGYVTVEAVEAGNNPNHSVNKCVGYILTLSDGITVYISGDTSTTKQMATLADRKLDYAFFCCDGSFNMDIDEAAKCAALVQAKHSIPYHVIVKNGQYFDRKRAEQFKCENRLIIDENEEIELRNAD